MHPSYAGHSGAQNGQDRHNNSHGSHDQLKRDGPGGPHQDQVPHHRPNHPEDMNNNGQQGVELDFQGDDDGLNGPHKRDGPDGPGQDQGPPRQHQSHHHGQGHPNDMGYNHQKEGQQPDFQDENRPQVRSNEPGRPQGQAPQGSQNDHNDQGNQNGPNGGNDQDNHDGQGRRIRQGRQGGMQRKPSRQPALGSGNQTGRQQQQQQQQQQQH